MRRAIVTEIPLASLERAMQAPDEERARNVVDDTTATPWLVLWSGPPQMRALSYHEGTPQKGYLANLLLSVNRHAPRDMIAYVPAGAADAFIDLYERFTRDPGRIIRR